MATASCAFAPRCQNFRFSLISCTQATAKQRKKRVETFVLKSSLCDRDPITVTRERQRQICENTQLLEPIDGTTYWALCQRYRVSRILHPSSRPRVQYWRSWSSVVRRPQGRQRHTLCGVNRNFVVGERICVILGEIFGDNTWSEYEEQTLYEWTKMTDLDPLPINRMHLTTLENTKSYKWWTGSTKLSNSQGIKCVFPKQKYISYTICEVSRVFFYKYVYHGACDCEGASVHNYLAHMSICIDSNIYLNMYTATTLVATVSNIYGNC